MSFAAAGTCEECGETIRVQLYTCPGNPRIIKALCTPCVSPLCEWCGEGEAELSVGRRDNIHLCGECAELQRFKRRTHRVALR